MIPENLKIRAMDGSALVEGRLRLHGAEAFAAVLPNAGPNDLIGVELTHNKMHRSAIKLYSKTRRAADGLYAAAPPIASIEFGDAMPNLHRLARSMFGEATRKMLVSSAGVNSFTNYPLTVSFRLGGSADALPVYAHLEEVALEMERRKEGLAIRIEGAVLPFAIEKGGPLLEGVRLDCAVTLPPAYCRLASIGSFPGMWERKAEWHAGLSAPLSVPALGPGLVDWQQDPASRRCNGPFVGCYLHEHEMTIRPARRLWLDGEGGGHVEMDNDGPQVQLGLGRALLASLLAHDDHAHVSFRTGIGYIDGQTGRSVGESGGPMRQSIRWLDLKLDRDPNELRIEGEGELEPLAPSSVASVRSLGPRLQFNFALPRTWLLARGIELPRFWNDWKKELGVTDVW